MTENSGSGNSEYPRGYSNTGPAKNKRVAGVISPKLVQQILLSAGSTGHVPVVSGVFSLPGYSNRIVRLNLEDGRSLMIKRGRYSWMGQRFKSSRRASFLLRQHSPLVVPEHLPISKGDDNMPVLAYWYIPLPTLKTLWPGMSDTQRKELLRKMGRMLRIMHRIETDRYGPLGNDQRNGRSFSEFMEYDLQERLKPASWAHWPDAIPLIDRITGMISHLPGQSGKPSLVHNDLHLDNILCRTDGDEIRCVGLLDLEEAGGGRFESDLASALVLHQPLFSREQEKNRWLEDFDRYLLEGYGREPDPELMRFYRGYHLLNMGFFFAHNGDEARGEQIIEAVRSLL